MTENQPNCVSQNGKAKSEIVSEIARIVRKHGLDYDDWRYIAKRVRQKCELRPAKKGRKLPRILTADDFRRFYQVVDQADDVQHSLMLRLIFFTAMRVSRTVPHRGGRHRPGELQDLRQPGQGQSRIATSCSASRSPRPSGPTSPLIPRTVGCSRPGATRSIPPGESSRSSRRYAERAGVKATPHTFRHQAITWLTRHSGLADAELQLITGHARRETLAVYQHVALDGELEGKYQEAMKKVDL